MKYERWEEGKISEPEKEGIRRKKEEKKNERQGKQISLLVFFYVRLK